MAVSSTKGRRQKRIFAANDEMIFAFWRMYTTPTKYHSIKHDSLQYETTHWRMYTTHFWRMYATHFNTKQN